MKLPLYWIDAFTDQPFHGNPAAVVLLAAWPDPALMQKIAFENGLAETAFFVRTGPDRFHLRWFTPVIEMDLCGHATLASAFVIFHVLGQAGDRIVFDTLSGPLAVTRREALLEMDFPSRPATPLPVAQIPPTLLAGLGGPPPQWIGKSRDYLCVYPSAEAVLALQPDFAALRQIDVTGIIVTAPGSAGLDFVSRFFAPRAGINEDPVTGSAHCTLVPYWTDRLRKTKLHARQVSARGGELWCESVPAPGSGHGSARVKISGHAVTYLRGEIDV